VSSRIGPESFVLPAHRRIFGAISELVAACQQVDTLTVHDRLKAHGTAEACGGLTYLHDLASSVPIASGVRRYADIVADRYLRRALLAIADDARDTIADADSADAALDALQAQLGGFKRPGARSAPRRLGELVADAVTELNDVSSGAKEPGMSTGIDTLDKALGGGMKPGRVYVLAARTSVGKTSLALQILLNFGRAGRPALMLSLEMTGIELAGRAIAHNGRIGMSRIATAELEDWEWGALTQTADELAKAPVWIDDQPALRLVDIAAKAREIKRVHGLSLLVVDYLQLCEAEATKGDAKSRHHQIEGISRGFKALAKELGVAVLLLSQLTRTAEDGEPELRHLKESGALEEDADVAMLLFPVGNDADGSMVICCKLAKIRGGKRCRLALAFDGSVQQWTPSNADVSRRRERRGSKRRTLSRRCA
jgi:replicative DNA helicase